MSKKQMLNFRQVGNNTVDIPLATLHGYSLSKTFAQSHPYSGGTISCYLKSLLRWRCKQFLYKSTPCAGGTNSYFLKAL